MEHHTDWVNDIVLCCNGKTCKYFFGLLSFWMILIQFDLFFSVFFFIVYVSVFLEV